MSEDNKHTKQYAPNGEEICPRLGLRHYYWSDGTCQYCGKLSPIERLRKVAALLLTHAEHGISGDMPQWLSDCRDEIEAASKTLSIGDQNDN